MLTVELDREKDIVRKASSNFPGLETEEALTGHRQTMLEFMGRQEAKYAKQNGEIAGVLLFFYRKQSIGRVYRRALPQEPFTRSGALSRVI